MKILVIGLDAAVPELLMQDPETWAGLEPFVPV